MTAFTGTVIRQENATQDALLAPRAEANRVMSVIVGLHLAYCLALAGWHDTYVAFTLAGLPTGLIALYFTYTRPTQGATSAVVAVAFMILTALAVHQSHGMIEMHFGFFVSFAILLLYRDWRVYIPATAVALLYHITFNYLQQANWGVYGYTELGWHVVALHIYYVLFATVTLGYVAELMRREALDSRLLKATEEANGNLQIAERNLAALNTALEQRVAERTAELNVAKAAAEDANRAKTQFLAEMSHHIRDPLNSVLGMAELLQDTPLNEQQRKYIANIGAAGHTLHTVMSGTLDIGRIETRKMQFAALPAATDIPAPLPAGTQPETFALRILVAEDTRVHQEIMRSMLTRLGGDVTIAANGELALAAMANGRFDVVFMDCQMPVMDGYAATMKIREWQASQGDNPRIPVIAVTAHALAEDRQRCIDAGMDDFVTKPVALAHLKTVLARWARRQNT